MRSWLTFDGLLVFAGSRCRCCCFTAVALALISVRSVEVAMLLEFATQKAVFVVLQSICGWPQDMNSLCTKRPRREAGAFAGNNERLLLSKQLVCI